MGKVTTFYRLLHKPKIPIFLVSAPKDPYCLLLACLNMYYTVMKCGYCYVCDGLLVTAGSVDWWCVEQVVRGSFGFKTVEVTRLERQC